MSESKYRGNIGLIAVAVLVLFAASIFGADPADAHDGLREPTEQQAAMARAGQPIDQPINQATDLTAEQPAPEIGVLQIDRSSKPAARPGDLKAADRDGDDWEGVPMGAPDGLAAGGGTAKGFLNNCFVDFNDPSVLSVVPNNAKDTFLYWPHWTQSCTGVAGDAVAVEPIGVSHYHLGYVDSDIGWCLSLGDIGRRHDPSDPLTDCDEIDPITEPRDGIQAHWTDLAVRVLAHHPAPGPDERVQFNMNQISVLSGEVEVCFVRTDLPWITSEPTDDPSGYCGHLGVGNWDISASVTDAYEVRIWFREPNTTVTNIGIATL